MDGCGVCGGDGSTCVDNTDDLIIGYRWEFGHRLSTCTASCDGGKQFLLFFKNKINKDNHHD